VQKKSRHKFALFHRLQKFRESMPAIACHAEDDGWKEIAHRPDGYRKMDSCGCCVTEYSPGWYGISPQGAWKLICDLQGNILESAGIGGYSLD